MSYLDCFDDRIYLWSLLSLLAIGFFAVMKKQSFKELLNTLLTHLIDTFSNHTISRTKHLSDRILVGVCLMVSVVLVAAYSGVMYAKLMRVEPITTLKSLMELIDDKGLWKNSKLYTFYGIGTFDELFVRALLDRNSVEKRLFNRSLQIDQLRMHFDDQILKTALKDIFESNYVLSANRLLIYHFINRAKIKFPELMAHYEEGNEFLVSETEVMKPYFLTVLAPGLELVVQLNHMYGLRSISSCN